MSSSNPENASNNNDDDTSTLTPESLRADLASMGRVSHRLAMIDNAPQFESVVGKLLPKLLVRMGRNHQQQMQLKTQPQPRQQQLQPWLQKIQSKLMEIFSHILKRTKEKPATSSSSSNSNNSMPFVAVPSSSQVLVQVGGQASQVASEPLPCLAILELLVVQDSNNPSRYQVQSNVDALTKNLALTFLTVGVPRCPDAMPLIPGLLVCLHHERQRRATASTTTTPATTAVATLTLLLLQSLMTVSKTALFAVTKVKSPASTESTGPSETDEPAKTMTTLVMKDKLEMIRSFLQEQEGCAATLYELFLDVFLWTAPPTATTSSTLPPPGLSQYGQESLQQAISSTCISVGTASTVPLMGPEAKIALLDLIAPARRGLFLGRDAKGNFVRQNLARTLTLVLVAKGMPVTAERAQTYWQMYMQSYNNKTTVSTSSSPPTAPNRPFDENPTSSAPPTCEQRGNSRNDMLALSSVTEDLVLELLSLTLGQGQAEDIVSSPLANDGGDAMAVDSAALPSEAKTIKAMPLHYVFERGGSVAPNDPAVWAGKRRAVELTPTATALWTALATQIFPLNPATTITFLIKVSQMVAFLAQKYLSSSSAHGPSSAMSTIQARPYLALAQVLEAVILQLCKMSLSPFSSDGSAVHIHQQEQVENLKSKFMDIVGDLLRLQVTTSSPAALSSSSSSMIMNCEGSWAVREECYSILCHLFRSNDGGGANVGTSKDNKMVSIDTASLLFACAAKEHERLRPRAVAALDTLLEALTRIYKSQDNDAGKASSEVSALSESLPTVNGGAQADVELVNPWATTTIYDNAKVDNDAAAEAVSAKERLSLAKSLVPLLWNAAQPHQPKASRVAAARWATELLKKNELDLVRGCHLLCFLAGDADVTAAAIAKQGLFDGGDDLWHFDNDGETSEAAPRSTGNENNTNDAPRTTTAFFPDFANFVDAVFQEPPAGAETRVRQYMEFSFLGKVAALRFGLRCLLMDIYGGDDEAVARYLLAMMTTLEFLAEESRSSIAAGQDRTSINLLDGCCACLLNTLKSSSFARLELARPVASNGTAPYRLGLVQLEDMAMTVRSSKARRHLAGIVGVLYEDKQFAAGATSFSSWMSLAGADSSLSKCVDHLSQIEKNHFQLGRLHGVLFLSGHVLRAIRHRLLQFSTDPKSDHTRKDCTRLMQLLGKGVLHKEEAISRASVDAIGISLSFDTLDAPPFDETLSDGVKAALVNISNAIKQFCDGDVVDADRATELIRVGGIVLGATSNANSGGSADLQISRQLCVDAILSSVGSAAFRKEEEIALSAGEALGVHADSCMYVNSDLSWPDDFQDEFARKLPPQEHVLYFLTTQTLRASSPHKRTATAPALLGLVGRAARLVHSDGRNGSRSFVETVRSMLPKLQSAFVSLLADPKIKHFSRESCCLGLAACRGLAVFDTEGSNASESSIDSLNQRLLRAFGQTANYGGSAYQETAEQAAQRRAAERESLRERNVLEPFGIESEVGGAAGMGEAALGAYREMAAASLALGRPDILYALLILSISHGSWFAGSAREKYNAGALLGESSIVGSRTNTAELRRALRPHLGKLLPRILRACNDPNKQTREQMGVLWAGLTGGGAEARDAISEHFLSTVDALIKDASNKLWRARAGATGALAEVIVGRDWQAFGGGPPVLSDDEMYDDRHTEYSGVRLLRLWRVVVRALDDVRDAVRSNGERLGRSLRSLTIRLCDPSTIEKTDGERAPTEEEKAKWARDAGAASATSIRWLVKHGLNQTVSETQGLCISTLVELIAIAKPAIIEPSLPDLLRSLLVAMSALEPAALNYLQLRTGNQEGLERARLQLAQTGPLAKAVTKCIDLLPSAKQAVQRQVVVELESALRLSVGFATRAAVADTASMMCNTCPGAFSFPGPGNVNPTVRLMRAFYFAAERERGQGAKDKMIHALGNLASLCPGGSVRSLAVRACKRYKSSTGNNDDPTSRRAAAAALRAIAVRASNQMVDGGSYDVWSQIVLPVAFLGQKDADKKTGSLMKEVWEEGSASVETTVRYGISREEQLLPALVKESIGGLLDVSWARRIAGSKALEELCDLGVLGPLPRTTGTQKTATKLELERSRRRAEACFKAIGECVKLVLKPRLWTGKNSVVTALAKLASKWTALQSAVSEDFLFGWDGERGVCPWMPLAMDLNGDDLFQGDGWFKIIPMDTDEQDTDEAEGDGDRELDQDEKMALDADGTQQEQEQEEEKGLLDFSGVEEEDDAIEGVTPGTDQEMNSPQSSAEIVTFIGLCRALLKEALPDKNIQAHELLQEYMPYRVACLEACRDLLKSIPSSDIERKSLLYSKEERRLIACIQVNESEDKQPVIVANAIDCLGQCFWDNIGSCSQETMDYGQAGRLISPVDLCTTLRDISGKQQPAWTVRRSGALGLAALVSVCDASLLRNSKIIDVCMDCATYACRDKKFWRVREAGFRLLGALIRRAGPSSAQRESLLLEALLPYKEDMLRLLRASLTDSEPTVTALSTEFLSLLSWWH
ncbi:hypothetical protein ACA910_001033 [Epithemia clementina (nom. ined.)]